MIRAQQINVIAAAEFSRLAIGAQGRLPWCRISEDMEYFKELTSGGVVIMGRKTWESIGSRPLSGRLNIVVSKTLSPELVAGADVYPSLEAALTAVETEVTDPTEQKVFVIGGEALYREALGLGVNIYLNRLLPGSFALRSEITPEHFDTFFPHISGKDYKLVEADTSANIEFLRFSPRIKHEYHGEYMYLRALKDIINYGIKRPDRTGVGTRSLFGLTFRYDISGGQLPLFTTKKTYFKGIAEELLWFLRGSTDARELQSRGVRIWDGNTSREFLDRRGLGHLEEGDCGPVYGFQMRHWGAEYVDCKTDYSGKGFDQIAHVINLIRTDPTSRRIVMNLWNPLDLDKGCLPPCHVLYQWMIDPDAKEITCCLYQRSGDMGLGVPFNVCSASLMTYIIGYLTGYKPRDLVHTVGDAHVYENHVEALERQIKREPWPFPQLRIQNRGQTTVEDFAFEDFQVLGYMCHPGIKMPMAV